MIIDTVTYFNLGDSVFGIKASGDLYPGVIAAVTLTVTDEGNQTHYQILRGSRIEAFQERDVRIFNV